MAADNRCMHPFYVTHSWFVHVHNIMNVYAYACGISCANRFCMLCSVLSLKKFFGNFLSAMRIWVTKLYILEKCLSPTDVFDLINSTTTITIILRLRLREKKLSFRWLRLHAVLLFSWYLFVKYINIVNSNSSEYTLDFGIFCRSAA